MKIIMMSLLLGMSLSLVGQRQTTVDLYAYKVSDEETAVFDQLGLPDSWDCRIRTCPTKFKAENLNLYAMHQTDLKILRIKMRPRMARKLKSKKHFAFLDNDTIKVYKLNKGLVRTIENIKIRPMGMPTDLSSK